jgi:hypothetical protein
MFHETMKYVLFIMGVSRDRVLDRLSKVDLNFSNPGS